MPRSGMRCLARGAAALSVSPPASDAWVGESGDVSGVVVSPASSLGVTSGAVSGCAAPSSPVTGFSVAVLSVSVFSVSALPVSVLPVSAVSVSVVSVSVFSASTARTSGRASAVATDGEAFSVAPAATSPSVGLPSSQVRS